MIKLDNLFLIYFSRTNASTLNLCRYKIFPKAAISRIPIVQLTEIHTLIIDWNKGLINYLAGS